MKAEWFAGRLRELREQAGLTQQDLAVKAGITKDALARLERGPGGSGRMPSWETAVSLAVALGATPNDFCIEPKTAGNRPRGRPTKA